MPPRGLCEWETVVSSHMPHLSKPQVKVLALYSFGMAMTRSCGLTGIVCFLGELLEKKEWALREAVAGVELRCCGQGGQEAASGGGGWLFRPTFALGALLVGK